MNRKICRETMKKALLQLALDIEKTDFFITHAHADHMGLVTVLAGRESKIYFERQEVERLQSESLTQWAVNGMTFSRAYGFPDEAAHRVLQSISRMRDDHMVFRNLVKLDDGNVLKSGDYTFTCIATPGHSRGHMCLYEADQKVLISGDHILGDITPNISSRYNEDNPLAEYLASLDKIYSLDVRLVLPGHRSILTDLKGRINELKHHHQVRTEEVLNILKAGDLNAFEVASRMTWDMTYETIEEFPVFSQWFAFSEALSHLQYLESLGKVRRVLLSDHNIVYSVK